MRVGSKEERVKSRKERGRMERWSQHKELSYHFWATVKA